MEKPKAKVTISLDADVLASVKERVSAGAARSVSSYLERAIVGQLAAEADFDRIIDEMLAATGGPPTRKERAAARKLLSGSAA